MKKKRAILHIDESLCNGCGQCVPDCAEGAIQIRDGKAVIVSDALCDGLGACLGSCPTGALTIGEREAVPFDEAAAMTHAAGQRRAENASAPGAAEACPGGALSAAACSGTLIPEGGPFAMAAHSPQGGCPGAQGKDAAWPVKIRLISPEALFLRGADLVVAADCAAPVTAGFFESYAKGSVVLIGCPKFEDAAAMKEKLAAVFRAAAPRSCTVVRMEVPCCQGIAAAVRQAYEAAGGNFPLRVITLSRRGGVVGK